jgi:hypothetical protein
MIIPVIGILIILIFIFKYINLLRYDLKYYFLYLWTTINKYNFVYVTDLNLAKKVLESSIKGQFIEQKIAKKAWYPILSIESEDHENYYKLKENLLLLFKEQPSLGILKNIIIEKCLEYNNNYEIIDSKITSIIVADVFVTYLFNENLTCDGIQHLFNAQDTQRVADHYHDQATSGLSSAQVLLKPGELELLYNGSIEWRKEIAIKGKGDINIKNNVIELIKNLLKNSKYTLSKTYSDIFSYSVICQPYIISPMINVTDILYYYDNNLYEFTKNDLIINCNNIKKIISDHHPFPVLERYDEITNTQYYIPMEIIKDFPFGFGPRKCPGQNIALLFIETFLKHINKDKFKPKLNHLYSGRSNDNKDDIYSIIYQIKIIFNLLINKN